MSDLHLGRPGADGFPPLAKGVDIVLVGEGTIEGLDNATRGLPDHGNR
ncbi:MULTISPECIES: hypothetical protein [unclassified Bradyrhizobium]|nr:MULTISPECIES: hypothetical protein [unclassified Bradyrhizobium]MCK1506962.1 hypothetical protein [Bradyrhizobium sp. 18]MCK1570068.1 hypothetical protein [Bradyrhizobium sp. 173]